MQEERLATWRHSHTFGQDLKQPGEVRTLMVIGLTTVMMALEITAGLIFGSMALLADGLHMGSHAMALGIAAFAYIYARKHATSAQFSFGTGKVNTLGGYTGAVLLAVFAAIMAWESLSRLLNPVAIAFDQAIVVAVLGLLVNGISVLVLGDGQHHHHGHTHDHDHDHTHDHHDHHAPHQDHNLRSAYLHVLADALTSLLAIVALLAGKYFGAAWMDPVMGIVGAILVARWSLGLLRSTSSILLDAQAPLARRRVITEHLEVPGHTQIVDLHLWSVGPAVDAAVITLVSREPRSPDYYKARLPTTLGLDHITIEVHAYPD